MKAVITSEFPPEACDALVGLNYEVTRCGWGVNRRVMDEDELVAALEGAELLICELERVDESLLRRCPDLRVVASCRGNPTNVDLAAAERYGVWVLNAPGRNADSVADFTIGLMIALQRNIVAANRYLVNVGWEVNGDLPYLHFRGREVTTTMIGLLGCGAVGRKVAERLIGGFGARVLVYDPYAASLPAGVETVKFEELFNRCDLVSLHSAVPADGAPLVGREQLEALGRYGLLVNTARAALVDEGELVESLTDGTIAGAALDVFWREPIERDHPLLRLPNVILTPHVAGAADDVQRHHATAILSGLVEIRNGRTPSNTVVKGTDARGARTR